MKALFWIIRILLSIGLIIKGSTLASVYSDYTTDSYLAESAPQATQLSNEFILIAFEHLSYILTGGVLYIAFELIVISYYLRKNQKQSVSINTSNPSVTAEQ